MIYVMAEGEMTRGGRALNLLTAALLWAPAVGHAAASPGHSAAGLALKNAQLGMSLSDWRALPFPGRADGRVVAACSDGPAPGPAQASTLGVTVCSYVARYGPRFVLPQSFQWDNRVLVHAPRYAFSQGRLSSIQFTASIDAFDPIVARFKARYGRPDQIDRGQTKTSLGLRPSVDMVWETPSGVIELIDPAPDPTRLSVSFSAGSRPAAKIAVSNQTDLR